MTWFDVLCFFVFHLKWKVPECHCISSVGWHVSSYGFVIVYSFLWNRLKWLTMRGTQPLHRPAPCLSSFLSRAMMLSRWRSLEMIEGYNGCMIVGYPEDILLHNIFPLWLMICNDIIEAFLATLDWMPSTACSRGRADALEQGLLENVEEKNPMKEVQSTTQCTQWLACLE